ncbi:MAG: 2-amino-4-hydroxy-6-hydroxymethyldihydropteridine diphosphokinase [Phycisphaerae bacterium]|jgi:2-amino-4-hydroxy-6-hydroxymethyldihydropteridine diphosphokinase|nr:2-amino-4-hydroxy-6-hydroxymethyldihydropteridine diphosphokinase [Phycisphaerae bacterium]
MATVYLGLGSNLGNRDEHLDLAVDHLRRDERLCLRKVSERIETEPVGGPAGQGQYLNAAAEIETQLAPEELLQLLKSIEVRLGRVPGPRWGPRVIDIDILLYGDVIVEGRDLEIPHPRMHERRFALLTLAQIAPDAVHPRLGKTIRQLLADFPT